MVASTLPATRLLVLGLPGLGPIPIQWLDDGLPQNSVLAILQTRDGYLWLTTSDGLVRFDGVRFTIYERSTTRGLSSNRLTALFEDRNGALWIGTEDRGVIRYENGAFTSYTRTNCRTIR